MINRAAGRFRKRRALSGDLRVTPLYGYLTIASVLATKGVVAH
jgi:hypothetical protein